MLRQLLDEAAARLQRAGIERPRFEARLLLAQALGISIETIIGDDARELTAQQREAALALVERRANRQPMAQILGRREFYGRSFIVTPDVLTPRPDSETLIEAAIDHFAGRATARILDLGTGSGCLLLTLLAEYPHARGWGIDKSPAALAVARANAEVLGLADRAIWQIADWGEAGWSDGLGRFDLIAANPPYIARGDLPDLEPELRYEPVLALDGGADGLDVYRLLAKQAPHLLTPGGLAIFEVGAGQAQPVAELLAQAGFTAVSVRKDLAGIGRCVLAASP